MDFMVTLNKTISDLVLCFRPISISKLNSVDSFFQSNILTLDTL